MLHNIFTLAELNMSIQTLLIATAASILLGIGVALVYMYKNTYSKSFVITLLLLPTLVQLVILLVNGNLGTGVAVAGAFSLIRFRSIAGNARDICSIFFAMAIGLATGTGYIGVAVIFFIIIGLVNLLFMSVSFGESSNTEKSLKITIPENLDYSDLFVDIFKKYTASQELLKVRTTNMGSLYELQYQIVLKKDQSEKAFLDAIRTRNGNLPISLGRVSTLKEEL